MVCLKITALPWLKSCLLVRETGGIIFIIVIFVKVIICVWHECFFASVTNFVYTYITLNAFQNTSSMVFYLIRRDVLQLSKEQQQQQKLL